LNITEIRWKKLVLKFLVTSKGILKREKKDVPKRFLNTSF